MTPVDYVWAIPALPLAALLIIFLVTRPLDIRSRRVKPSTPAAHEVPTGSPDAAGVARAEHIETEGEHAHGGAPADEPADAHGAAHGHAEVDDESGHGGHGGNTPGWALAGAVLGVTAMLAAFGLAIAILIQFLGDPNLQRTGFNLHLYNWFNFGNLSYSIDFRVDPLTAIMLVVVTSVSMLVHLYSIGYLKGDPGFSRFFIELSLFTVAMLILVLGANFLVLFIGWELVGLSSYLLIGFWFNQPPPDPASDIEIPWPPAASLKAFVTTRLGDFGFLIGILILFGATGTFNFVALNTATRGVNVAVVTLAMILIFCGAVGKSAQFPLHVWLPDAMAGPTPVSALIHAATMVAAGVYLVARLFPIYYAVAGPQALLVVAYIGGFTALFAATIALVQNDIKAVLAYSTISQLAYMFVGLGVADNISVGMFHLFTHAFFKALLFLGSGSVIHAVTVQDMRKMGGLAKFMPITAVTFLIATLSISGIPPFAGFWSKDPIIGAAFEWGKAHNGNYSLYILTLVTAGLTAFYMFRLFFLTFGGRGGRLGGLWGGREQYRGEAHPHESPWVMWLPLVLLAIPSTIAGFWALNSGFANFITAGSALPYTNPFTDGLTYFGLGMAVLGIAIAWLMYGLGVIPATALTRNPLGAFCYRVLKKKYYLDELYGAIIRYVVLGLCNFAAGFDRIVIDGVVNGSARTVRGLGDATRRSETGFLQNYGAAIFGGAMILLVALFLAVAGVTR
jgi:proton-translocating NADH-quinone oxidoreductase chain L